MGHVVFGFPGPALGLVGCDRSFGALFSLRPCLLLWCSPKITSFLYWSSPNLRGSCGYNGKPKVIWRRGNHPSLSPSLYPIVSYPSSLLPSFFPLSSPSFPLSIPPCIRVYIFTSHIHTRSERERERERHHPGGSRRSPTHLKAIIVQGNSNN